MNSPKTTYRNSLSLSRLLLTLVLICSLLNTFIFPSIPLIEKKYPQKVVLFSQEDHINSVVEYMMETQTGTEFPDGNEGDMSESQKESEEIVDLISHAGLSLQFYTFITGIKQPLPHQNIFVNPIHPISTPPPKVV